MKSNFRVFRIGDWRVFKSSSLFDMSSATSFEEIGICWLRFDLFWSCRINHQKINFGRVANPESKIFDKTFLENIGQTFDFIKISKVIFE